jgi:hypothetical protein
MASTYVNDLRLEEIGTGDQSGTWGNTTNLNLELIGQALGYGTQQSFSADADVTTTIADGAVDPARAMYFKVTSAGNLTATRTLTIAPNTISRVMFIENATSGSQSIAISQGSGANVTIAAGKTAVVYLDGAGATAAVVDAMSGVDPGVTDTLTEVLVAGNTSGGTNIELSTTDKVQFRDAAIYINSSVDGQLDIVADTEIQIAATTIDINGTLAFDSLKGTGATTVTNILDEDNMASDSATAIATQQSIKAYVDSQVGSFDTLAEVLAQGNTTGGTDLAVSTGDDITFADSSKAIFGAGSDLQIYHNGSGSFISDQGAGPLTILTSGFNVINPGNTETLIDAVENGAVQLYYDNAAKLATTATGIDVTGAVTADGLVVNAGTDKVVLANNFATTGNTDSPKLAFYSFGDVATYPVTGPSIKKVNTNSYGAGDLVIYQHGPTDYTNEVEALRIDASGNVGIGTSSPEGRLDVNGGILSVGVSTGDDVEAEKIRIGRSNSNVRYHSIVASHSGVPASSFLAFNIHDASGSPYTAQTQALKLQGNGNVLIPNGNVGIGTSSPSQKLDVKVATDAKLLVQEGNTAGNVKMQAVNNAVSLNTNLEIAALNTQFFNGGTERMRIDASGNVGIGVVPSAWSVAVPALQLGICGAFLCAQGATEALYLGSNAYYNGTNWIYAVNAPATYYRENGGAHAWFNAPSGTTGDPITFTQAMTLDASGNLLVGKTTTALATAGLTLGGAGFASLTRSGAEALNVNRLSSDGDLAVFYKDSVAVGSIGSISGVVSYINLDPRSGGTGIAGTNTDSIIPVTGTGAVADGTKDLGLTTARWRNLYLSGGVYLGGTGAANKLDDYEFGTWTPTATSSVGTITSVTSEIGTYTKIGRLVTLQYQFNIATLGTASGNIIVSGMPFTEDNTEITYYAGIHRARSGTSSFTEFDPAGTLQLYGTTPVAGVYLGSIVYNTTS